MTKSSDRPFGLIAGVAFVSGAVVVAISMAALAGTLVFTAARILLA
ncbi:hypothetical protein [Mesorhizobium marinum]|uniref:Uncharacterized protein n=1 Tax=Mesorhizobium marinum TaxID=3228790 RepID=A0ABV3R1A4_9HYPH